MAYLRHSYSSLLRSVGTDLKVMQELLRHSSFRSTLDVYTQAITPARHAAQAAALSLVFSPVLTGTSVSDVPAELRVGDAQGGKGSLGVEDTKRVQKCIFLHPRWFDRSRRNSCGMNGGDDETRTRDLCRDRNFKSLNPFAKLNSKKRLPCLG